MKPDVEQEEPLSVRVQATRSDYVHAYRRQFWHALGWLLLLAPVIALLPVERTPAFRSELFAGLGAAIAVAAAACLGIALFLAFMIELLARSYSGYALRKSPAAFESRVLTFTENGMQAAGTHVRWNEFSKVVETSDAFELQLRAGQYVLLPQRQIPCAFQMRRMLRTHLGKSAKLRG
jgi:hypothetical protein